jgi:hypothetical protein
VAVDGAGNSLTYSGGTWSKPQSIDPSGGGAALTQRRAIAVEIHGDGRRAHTRLPQGVHNDRLEERQA